MRDPRGCDATCKAMWQSHASPHGRLPGTNVARTRGKTTRVHADARVAPRGKTVFGLASDGPTGIVGPGKIVGAVMRSP